MTEHCDNEKHCQQQFDILFEKLDRIDVAIRGNGKPGIIVRLDRLEQSAKSQAKLIWLLAGAVAAGLTTAIATILVNFLAHRG
jgi:hypothetical protein